ncbi:MAG TPA: ABC transporter substrate-binding protein [Bdellovibrionales bacterium]|nr:ABC transporter substrate-binding protein [Bdellovibrionales bacterium]
MRALWLVIIALSLNVGCTKKKEEPRNSVSHSFNANVKGLDPVQASDVYTHEVVAQISEGLFQYHYLKRPFELEPLLADGMPQVSKDGLTYTFKIKKGVRFADDAAFPDGKGREVTAEDFIYSWKRVADPASQGEGFWIFDGKIKGLNEWRTTKPKVDYAAAVEGLQAPDKHTLVVKLTKPYYQFMYVLAMSYTMVVPREAVEKYGAEYLNHPVGTGPFMLKEWVRNNKIVLVRNPNFRGETYPTEGAPGDKEAGLLADAGKPIPFVDEVVFNELPEDQPRWLTFLKGNADFNSPPKDNFDQMIEGGKLKKEWVDKGLKVLTGPELDVVYDVLNTEDPVLGKSKYLRQAMSHAINRKLMIEKLYNGRALIAEGPIPPNIEGYDPNFKSPYSEYNVEKAKELLKKANLGDKQIEINYETTNSATARQFAEFVQQEMAAIGIKLNIKINTWPEMMEKNKKKKAQMFGMAWQGDYPDAENFLQLFYGPNEAPGPNSSNFKNKEFDELYKKAASLPPGAERTRLYQRMRDIVVEEVPWIFKAHRLMYMVHHGWLHNLKYDKLVATRMKYLRVDAEKRAEMKGKL